jgi:beta-phosphoglucomutase
MENDNSLTLKPALVFDMDGVLVDNLLFHQKAWILFCKRYLIELTEEEFVQKMFGGTNKDLLSRVFGKPLNEDLISKYANEKETIYRDLHAPSIQALKGVKTLITEARRNGSKTAVATAGPAENLAFVLEKTGMNDMFDVKLNDSHVQNGKPDPEIYLKASNLLGVPANRCIAFEDSLTGIKSAMAAGMKVIGVATSQPAEALSHSWKVIHDFTEINIQDLYDTCLK